MGISEGLPEGVEVDCSAGTIVWVRRRNGSWWPGRILGPEELSASHLMSPRSGTPVKLLGREDASVDWYNLEKSKRVKAFRCGEFDDCIERAESSQGVPIKKREKYARREDAILHALELERQQLEKKQQKFSVTSDEMIEKVGTPENLLDNSESTDPRKYVLHRSNPQSKRSDSSLEEEGLGNTLYVQKGKDARQGSWEDDNSEAVPRMRGLQDFGLRIAPSRRKISTPVDNSLDHVLSNHVNSGKNSMAVKRKRSHGGSTEELLIKRRDRRRPLVQVLQSSAKLPSCQSLPSNGDAVSLSTQGEREQVSVVCRAKRSKCVYLPAESDDCLNQISFPSDQMQLSGPVIDEEEACSGSSEEESDSLQRDYLDPDMEDAATLLSDPNPMATEVPTDSGRSLEKKQTIEPDDPDDSSYGSQLQSNEQTAGISANMGGSKWQLKGKRNIRNLTKRSMEVSDSAHPVFTAEKCNGSTHGQVRESKGNVVVTPRISQRASAQGFYGRGDGLSYGYDDGDLIENDLVQAPMEYSSRRYPFMLKSSNRDRRRRNHDLSDSDEDSQAGLRGYWEDSDEGFNPVYVGHLGNGMDSMLVDVDLKVQASYQGERVPLVSLMSRLNGKAIVGHPVQIETLAEGSTDVYLSNNDYMEEDNDGNSGLTPVWRTARRTAMHRVPRPPPSMEGEESELLQYSDAETKYKPYADQLNHKARFMKKSYLHGHSPLADKRSPKKQMKRANLSNQKTRTLSSIAIEQTFNDPRHANKNRGLIKSEESAPSIACVPVKLVFSRILEAVGRQPCNRSERQPS
ncbi:hypothetical protein H6P81_007278 [Aristolochia fimbriata]|uniref:PWWP domain-containing protein n=1 Tax=Aristolochia fimbriata TaxID=158543 RepID=A0AAV7F117_ARIFI|nr:hypothetical protein H6P81_007278 [Aristolochia fimbriata]